MLFIVSLSLSFALTSSHAQDLVVSGAPRPAALHPAVLVVGEEVVTDQWPAAGDPINVPVDLRELQPSQCARFGIMATGDGHEGLVDGARIAIQLTYAGEVQSFPGAAPVASRRVKPTGTDFVNQALGVIGRASPDWSNATLAVTDARWCVPEGAQDGAATVTATVVLRDGSSVPLEPRPFAVRTFASARGDATFTDPNELAAWLQSYYTQPSPAARAHGAMLLHLAGYDARPLFKHLSPQENALVRSVTLPDP